MAHEPAWGDTGGGSGDLRVGNAQKHHVGPGRHRPRGREGLSTGYPAALRAGGEGTTEAAIADDGEARTARGGREGIPFQFPHLRYRSAE